MSDVMINAQDLSKQYGPVHALRNVSFEVPKGEVVGFLGPNGAGKTTTMKILTCFIAPTDGTATVNGCDVFDDPVGVRSAIGYLPESTPLYTDMLTVEYLQFVARMRGFSDEEAEKRIKKVVEQTGLGDVVGKEIRALSKGYRQRTGLAQALIHEPPILILDEPLSGLDPNQAVEIRDLIKEIGKERTVILSTHNLAEVQVTSDRVLIVAQGKIVADDTPEGLRERAGKPHYEVAVLDKADGKSVKSDEVREQLAKIDGVDKIRPRETANDELRFDVVPKKDDQDLRPEIFRAAVDAGYVLVGLQQHTENLEAVFQQLTAGRSGDSATLDAEEKEGGDKQGDAKRKKDGGKKTARKGEDDDKAETSADEGVDGEADKKKSGKDDKGGKGDSEDDKDKKAASSEDAAEERGA